MRRGRIPGAKNLVPYTHCRRGHPCTPENSYYRPGDGRKVCRPCMKIISTRVTEERASAAGRKVQLPPKDRTHCPKGHEYSPENTLVRANGNRACRECCLMANRAYFAKETPKEKLCRKAKERSVEKGIPFSIVPSDIPDLPKVCPVLGIEIKKSSNKYGHSPSLDKFVPALGYVPGNVHIVSHRANRIKSDATTAEIGKIHDWMLKVDANSSAEDTSYLRFKY